MESNIKHQILNMQHACQSRWTGILWMKMWDQVWNESFQRPALSQPIEYFNEPSNAKDRIKTIYVQCTYNESRKKRFVLFWIISYGQFPFYEIASNFKFIWLLHFGTVGICATHKRIHTVGKYARHDKHANDNPEHN